MQVHLQIWSILVLFGEGIKTKKPVRSTFDGLLTTLGLEPADRTVVQSAFLNLLSFTTLNNKVLFFTLL